MKKLIGLLLIILILLVFPLQSAYTSQWFSPSKSASYAELYETGGTSAITVTTGGTYYQWVSSTAGTCAGAAFVTCSVASDDITINASGAGVYFIAFSVSFSNDTITDTTSWYIHKGGAIQTNIGALTENPVIDQTYEAGSSGILTLAAADTIDLRVTSTTNEAIVTVNNVNLTIIRLE